MMFRSTAKQAATATKRCMDANEQARPAEVPEERASTDKVDETFSPDYHKVFCLVEAADCESVLEMGMVGVELLSMRSDVQEKAKSKLERTTLSKQMKRDWEELKRLAAKRSIRRVDLKVVPFLNIYDKGYRAKMAALRNGKQQVLQPDWADSDRRFSRAETINSASVASDRGGNERSVNVSKRAGFISRGFRPNMCPVRFNKAWRTWTFQSNFMFKPHL